MEIEVQNFQSIRHAKVGVEGFTTIVGRSNIGKSALVRAVRMALTGAVGKDFVRHDPESCSRVKRGTKTCQCFASVRIKLKDLEVLWEKGDGVNRYTVTQGGKKDLYNNPDRGTPPFLVPAFSPVDVGGDKVLVQVSEQFSPIFLLGESGGTIAEVLGDFAKVDDVNTAIRLVAKDLRGAKSLRKTREEDLVRSRGVLQQYDGLDAAAVQARSLEGRLSTVREASASVSVVRGFDTRLNALVSDGKALKRASSVAVPTSEEAEEAFAALKRSALWIRGLKSRKAELLALRSATEPPMPDLEAVVSAHSRVTKLAGMSTRHEGLSKAVEALSTLAAVSLPDSQQPSDLMAEQSRLFAWVEQLTWLQGLQAKGESVRAVKVPSIEEVTAVGGTVSWLAERAERYAVLEEEIDTLQEKFEELEAELETCREKVEALGLCPTCGRALEEDDDHAHLQD
jgi:hypothetical protein